MKTVVIIGAGPAGLTAAYDLKKQAPSDYNVILVEESGEIGGISRTVRHNRCRIDLGGHRFFSKNQQVNALWNEVMPMQGRPSMDDILLNRKIPLSQGGPDPEKEDRVMLLRRRVSRIYYLQKFFDYPISVKPQTFINMGFSRTMKAGFGYLASCVHKLPVTSLENFYINQFGRPLYEMFFEHYTENLWGVHPSQIAPDWGAQRVKGLSLMKVFTSALMKPFRKDSSKVETSLIEQFSYPKYGPGQFWETMAQDAVDMGAELRLNSRAVRFTRNESGRILSVITADPDGKETEIPCDAVFSSMPIKDLSEAMPNLPQDVKAVAEALPYRDFMTVGLLVDKLKIKNQTKLTTLGNIVPDCWIYIHDASAKIGRMQIFNNWSPYMLEDPEHTVWIGLEYFCSEGDEMWNMSDEAFTAFAREEVERIGLIEKNSVKDSIRIRVKKAYPAYFGSYAEMDKVRRCLNDIPNLYCIGRNGQHRYNNMDHSMLTALEASRLLRTGSTDREALWNINAEESYHEEGGQHA